MTRSPMRQLVRAVLASDLTAVRAICAANPGILQTRGGFEPLIVAARKGLCDIAEALLELGADPDAPPFFGPRSAHTNLERPLHWAASFGRHEMVKLLLERGADVEGGLESLTPLQSAARVGHGEICATLNAHGARKNLFVTVATGNLEEVSAMLDAAPAQVNAQDEYGTPPLHLAAEMWRDELVAFLLERGADAQLFDAHKDTALHKIAIRQLDDILSWGDADHPYAPPKDPSQDHLNESRQLATARLLIAAGTDVNAKNWRKVTPLHRAVRANRIGYVRLLVDQGAEVNAVNVAGETPLRRAVSHPDRLEVAEFLLQHGADANVCDRKGRAVHQLARGAKMKALLGSFMA